MHWIKTLAALTAVASMAASAVAQDRQATFGKSNAQILSMGYDAWYKFYIAKEGGSGVGMSSGPALYGDALAARNDRLLKAETPVRRRKLTALRTHLRAYANRAIEAGSGTTGGGTMWNSVSSFLYKDAEQTLYGLLVRRTPNSPARVVSDVTREISRQRRTAERQMAENDIDPAGRRRARTAFSSLERTYRSITAQADGLSRAESDLILNYCLGAVKGLIPTG
ncbi:MAG: hypothetical protein ACO1SV_27855 [Fimbriimonas sp.]